MTSPNSFDDGLNIPIVAIVTDHTERMAVGSGADPHDASNIGPPEVQSADLFEVSGNSPPEATIRPLRAIFDDAPETPKGPAALRSLIKEEADTPLPTLLPDSLWESRPVFEHIKQAAHSRGVSADVVLHCVLARVAASVDHTTKLPAIVGSHAPLCFFTALIGRSGSGKSSGYGVARELLPIGDHVLELPPGSGEGMVDALFDMVTEIDPETDKPGKPVKRQVRFNASVFADEGEIIAALSSRSGSTLLSTYRTIWTGGILGQANASAERKRIVPAGQYAFGITVGLQPSKAAQLLDDVDGGTPQRFAWASAIDPNIPDDSPTWPGELEWVPPSAMAETRSSVRGFMSTELVVDSAIATEIRKTHLAVQRGDQILEPLDAHRNLMRLKIAGLLAILDGRFCVTPEDWDLAGVILDTSDGVRGYVEEVVDRAKKRKEEAATFQHAQRQAAGAEAVVSRQVITTAERIVTILKTRTDGEGWTTWRKVQNDLSQRQREVYEEALAFAVDQGMVFEFSEEGQGEDKHTLHLPEDDS